MKIHIKFMFMACRIFELSGHETNVKLLAKDIPALDNVGVQRCMTFSVDGSRFASGGEVSIKPAYIRFYQL